MYINAPQFRYRSRPLLGAYHARPRRRSLRGLGQVDVLPASVYDPTTGTYSANPVQVQPGTLPLSQSSYYSSLETAQLSANPTDYSSPSSAIAAGLDPAFVNTSWAQGLAKYATQAQAVAAGIAPAVVQQFWAASRAYVTPSIGGISTTTLLWIAGGVFALAFVSGGKRRR